MDGCAQHMYEKVECMPLPQKNTRAAYLHYTPGGLAAADRFEEGGVGEKMFPLGGGKEM